MDFDAEAIEDIYRDPVTDTAFEEISHISDNRVWLHFYKATKETAIRGSKANRISMCKYCRKVLKCSTSNLWKHVERFHQEELNSQKN